MNINTFRMLRQGFADPLRYPDGLVQHYLTLATNQLDSDRWCDLLDEGLCDYVSHFLVVAVRNAQAAERGAVSGNSVGRVTSKSVGGVSVNYDTGGTEETDGGHWNTTTYGSALLRNARMVGSGGAQLGINVSPVYGLAGAWPGPWIQ